MNFSPIQRVLAGLALCLPLWLCGTTADALTPTEDGTYVQSFTLRPGWTAIYLHVRPNDPDIDSIFSGLPVESVWGWFPPAGQIEFLDDPAVGLTKAEGWRGWYPRPKPESLFSNLFALEANRAYLIKLEGTEPRQLDVAGLPLNLPIDWVPDSYNLVGFHVDPAAPPNFGGYLAQSAAHVGQAIFRLDPAGTWVPVASAFSAPIHAGEAYWIYTEGGSSFQGPLEVSTEAYEGLEYSAAFSQQRLSVHNRSPVDANLRVRMLPSNTAIPFLGRDFTDTEAQVFEELEADSTLDIAAGQELFFELGVRRADLDHDRSEQILEITDGLGSRRLVFAGVTRIQPAAPLSSTSGLQAPHTKRIGANPYAGLWVGDVYVNKVSQSQTAGTTPVGVGQPFNLRLLIHVDASGQVRLLEEVTQLWKEGTTRPDPQNPGFNVVDVPGEYVLVTDESLFPNYSGAALRDGAPVGLRLSTVGYDVPGVEVVMSGAMGPSGNLAVTLEMGADDPTNPYKHRYHPDHDNLDAQFLEPEMEAFDITRAITLEMSADHPSGRPGPDWGDSELGGTYRETIRGVHRNAIYVEGLVLLTRVAATPELNG